MTDDDTLPLEEHDDGRPAWMEADERNRLADWKASPEFAEAAEAARNEAILGDIQDRARWAQEAKEIRRYTETLPVHPPDPEATAVLAKYLDAEARGLVRWTGTDWVMVAYQGDDPGGVPRDWQPLDWSWWQTRLEKFRFTGPDDALACCPSHDDRHPSLTVARGRVWWLLTCWSGKGCDSVSITAALGVDLHDLALH